MNTAGSEDGVRMLKRRSARVLLFDPTGAILLIRYVVPQPTGEFVFWITPGGEIEDDETPIAAARRELHEELGLTLAVEGPIREEANQFLHQGVMRDNLDFFFRARCGRDAPRLVGLTPEEIVVMKEIRWWTREEIAVSSERIFPVDLAHWLRLMGALGADGSR